MLKRPSFSLKQLQSLTSEQGFRLLLGFVLLAHLVALAFYAALGFHARYTADDYCQAYILRDMGFFPSQVYWYTTLVGRFAYNFTFNTILAFGAPVLPIIPLALLLALLAGWSWIFHQAGRGLHFERPALVSVWLATGLVFVVLASSPDVRQVLYWASGISNYLTPLIFLALILGTLTGQLRRVMTGNRSTRISMVSIFALPLFAGGFTEVYSASQMVVFALLLLGFIGLDHSPNKRQALLILSLGLAGAVLSFLIVYFSPAVAIRQQNFPPHPALFALVGMTLEHLAIFLKRQVELNTLLVALAILAPMMVTFLSGSQMAWLEPLYRRHHRRFLAALFLVPLIGLALITVCFAVHAWATSSYPPGRTILIPNLWLMLTLMVWGGLAGLGMRAEIPEKHGTTAWFFMLLLLALAFFGPLRETIRLGREELPVATRFARAWDEQDAFLRQAAQQGVQSIGMPAIDNYYHVEQLRPPSSTYYWVNGCVSRYYQIPDVHLSNRDP